MKWCLSRSSSRVGRVESPWHPSLASRNQQVLNPLGVYEVAQILAEREHRGASAASSHHQATRFADERVWSAVGLAVPIDAPARTGRLPHPTGRSGTWLRPKTRAGRDSDGFG